MVESRQAKYSQPVGDNLSDWFSLIQFLDFLFRIEAYNLFLVRYNYQCAC